MMMNRFWGIVFFVVFLLIFPSCSHSENEEVTVEKTIDYMQLQNVLNNNIQSIRQLVELKRSNKQLFSVSSSDEKTLLFFLEEEQPVALYKVVTSKPVLYPCLSIESVDDDYCWTLSGNFLTNTKGERIRVTNDNLPSVHFLNDQWNCSLGDTIISVENSQLSYGYPTVERMDEENAYISFPSHFQLPVSMSAFQLPNVPNRVFYKDIFLDAGIGLNPRKYLSASGMLRMPLESLSLSRNDPADYEYDIQNEMLVGNSDDSNGRLLYPDGQPRYKLLFVNGGSSTTHGKSLDEQALINMRSFVQNGGSYLGACAGAFFASNGYDDKIDYPYYLSLIPLVMNHTGITSSSTGMFIEQQSPLLNYYNFGNDLYVEDVYHSRGGYPTSIPEGVEVLARFDRPDFEKVHKKPCIMAYKTSGMSGRIVTTGSHPEYASDGEIRDLTASMILYAIDGLGYTSLKGFLQNGKVRQMDKSTEDNDPMFTKIGDKQCHHFAVYIPTNANNITVMVKSEKNCDLALRMCRDTFAFPDNADYSVSAGGASQQLSFKTLEEGIWYVSVQCLTTVDIEQTDYGQSYIGRTDVLNGVPYHIQITWD